MAAGPELIHHLPHPTTPFLGREREIAAISARLDDPTCQLLTLLGPGGIGKTRLAIEVARRKQQRFLHGVHFIPLNSLQSAEHLVQTVITVLHIQQSPSLEPQQNLLKYLRDRHMLLILDNFEHLLDAIPVVLEILAACTHMKLLLTSREALNIQEEWLWPLQGLDFPESQPHADLQTYSALRLFTERASRVQPDFNLEQEREPVLRICRLVEGMPLALELAAAWLRSFSCEAIADEIQTSLDFLRTNTRNLPERHRSIQAVFDQSWRLLSLDEQAIFRRLSVFQGGFTREAAAVVSGAALDSLAALVEKSLLRRSADGRYSLHSLLQQYAARQLEVAGEHETAHDAHCAFFCDFLQQREPGLKSAAQMQARASIEAEIDNVRAAWRWAVRHGQTARLAQCLDSLLYFFHFQTRHHEALDIIAQALDQLNDSDDGLHGQLWILRGWFLSHIRFNLERVITAYQQGLALVQRAGLQATCPFPLYMLSWSPDDFGGVAALEESYSDNLSIFQHRDDRWGIAWSMFNRGHLAHLQRQHDEAQRLLRESEAQFRALGDRWGLAFALGALGAEAYFSDAYHDMRPCVEEALQICIEIKDLGGIAHYLGACGALAYALGDHDLAKYYCYRNLFLCVEYQFSLARPLGYWFERTDKQEALVELLSFVYPHALPLDQDQAQEIAQVLAEAEARISPEVAAAARQRGQNTDLRALIASSAPRLAHLALSDPGFLLDADNLAGTAVQRLVAPLTAREQEILALIVEGLSNQDIAERLIVGLSTVKKHINNLYGKLGVRSRGQAIARAHELGLL